MIETAPAAPPRFGILTVCTGNICRSPLTEYLLRQGMERWTGIDVASAGTDALVGNPMTTETIAIAKQYGVAATEEHRARLVAVEQLRESSLVLALTREHRSAIVALLPRGSRRTFTLRELARLLEALQPSDLAAVAVIPLADTAARFTELVNVAAGLRGFVAPPVHDLDDDVVDPYRRGDEVYRESTAQIVPAVEMILRRLELAATITPSTF